MHFLQNFQNFRDRPKFFCGREIFLQIFLFANFQNGPLDHFCLRARHYALQMERNWSGPFLTARSRNCEIFLSPPQLFCTLANFLRSRSRVPKMAAVIAPRSPLGTTPSKPTKTGTGPEFFFSRAQKCKNISRFAKNIRGISEILAQICQFCVSRIAQMTAPSTSAPSPYTGPYKMPEPIFAKKSHFCTKFTTEIPRAISANFSWPREKKKCNFFARAFSKVRERIFYFSRAVLNATLPAPPKPYCPIRTPRIPCDRPPHMVRRPDNQAGWRDDTRV